MGVKQFSIELQNPMGVFRAGDPVHGQVTLDLDKPTKARGVVIKFVGAAGVHWSEEHTTGTGKDRRTETHHYHNSQSYFSTEVFLWGKGRGGLMECDQHPPGHVIYPFQFQLPPNLPSSFEGPYGTVRYWIECKVDRPWKFDFKCKRQYTVNAIHDLNMQPRAREPAQGEASKTLCCLCCASGPITNRLHVQRAGYVPGEYIVVTGEVDNHSRRKMSTTKLELRMATTYFATTAKRTLWKTIMQYKKGELGAGETAQWHQNIPVPPLPPSDLNHCDIIDIKYYIVLTTKPSGPAYDLEVPLEVVIGTVPLTDVQHMYSNVAPVNLFGNIPLAVSDAQAASILYPDSTDPALSLTQDAPPPTYAESIQGQVSIKDDGDRYTHGNLNYAPQYPYYTWNNK